MSYSYDGVDHYEARQFTAFGQMLWKPELGCRHTLLTGAALRVPQYDGQYRIRGRLR